MLDIELAKELLVFSHELNELLLKEQEAAVQLNQRFQEGHVEIENLLRSVTLGR
jgi:hypothetical protein